MCYLRVLQPMHVTVYSYLTGALGLASAFRVFAELRWPFRGLPFPSVTKLSECTAIRQRE